MNISFAGTPKNGIGLAINTQFALMLALLTAPVWADDAATIKGYESLSAPQDAEGIGEDVDIISCGGVQVRISEL